MQKAACSMHKARAHAPDELVRLGHLNQHDQSDHVCHCNCKALLCCKVVAYSSGVVDQEKKTACAACALIVDANNE